MIKPDSRTIFWFCPILFVLFFSYAGFTKDVSTLKESDEYKQVYKIGKEIAQGISISILSGLKNVDGTLKYAITKSTDVFTFQENTWPVIDVVIKVQSNLLNNPIVTYTLLFEIDKNTGTIVGTVKNILVDGKPDESLSAMNNRMFIETEEGTEEVTIQDGKIMKVEE